jgi:hypothetical protein
MFSFLLRLEGEREGGVGRYGWSDLLIRGQSGILIACLPGSAPPVLLVLIACDRALHPDGIFQSLELPKALFTNAPSKAVMCLKERKRVARTFETCFVVWFPKILEGWARQGQRISRMPP